MRDCPTLNQQNSSIPVYLFNFTGHLYSVNFVKLNTITDDENWLMAYPYLEIVRSISKSCVIFIQLRMKQVFSKHPHEIVANSNQFEFVTMKLRFPADATNCYRFERIAKMLNEIGRSLLLQAFKIFKNSFFSIRFHVKNTRKNTRE